MSKIWEGHFYDLAIYSASCFLFGSILSSVSFIFLFFKVRTAGHCEDDIHNQLLEHFLAWHMVKASATTNSTLLFLPATSHSVFSGRDFS